MPSGIAEKQRRGPGPSERIVDPARRDNTRSDDRMLISDEKCGMSNYSPPMPTS